MEQAFIDENDGLTKLYKGTITAIGQNRGVETIQIEFVDETVVISVPNLIKEIENGNIPITTISNGEDIEDEETHPNVLDVEDSNDEDSNDEDSDDADQLVSRLFIQYLIFLF